MLQVIEQTDKQKLKMYMKCKKKKLAKMLIECNKVISNIPTKWEPLEDTADVLHTQIYTAPMGNRTFIC